GENFYARVVISNANAIDTLAVMLDDQEIKHKYEAGLMGLEKSISAFQVYLGLKCPARSVGMTHARMSINPGYSHSDNFEYSLRGDMDKTILEIADHSQIDASLAPEGKGSLMIMTYDNYSRWEGLSKEEYLKLKQKTADQLIRRAEVYLPGLSSQIEIMEIATPLTMQRYGSSPEGAIYGFAETVQQSSMGRLAQDTQIKGLFLAGAWTRPGPGFHGCFVSGRDAAELVMRFLK
ncbi:MAG: NAD(P)/FAD-dependent oxidoreductase, partial [Candidatus Omnitrophica bacterium]|nr:NAD(P)/FAD-dependent oxidoreductase [Candidatus Omnitrophota bacterium]